MSLAAWERAPLLGTAMRRVMWGCTGFSEVGVDVVEGESAREHQHLGVVEQLADLERGGVLALVLGGHPRLGGLLDQLLADRMDAGIELLDGSRAFGSGRGLLAQLGPELLERLHGR